MNMTEKSEKPLEVKHETRNNFRKLEQELLS